MNNAAYERLGGTYSATRRPDPRVAHSLRAALGDARTVVNIGAGTGSYEPTDLEVVAVEPSQTMIAQRAPAAAPAVVGSAESLPLDDQSVDAALAILTVHHWSDLARAWGEIRRVVRDRAVFLTWDPDSPGFWLTRDYLPQIRAVDSARLPALEVFVRLGETVVAPLEIPHDCADGFLAAYWRRPHAYLDATVRANISAFDAIGVQATRTGIELLERDLETGRWTDANSELLDRETLDAGYRIVVCTFVR